MLKKFLRTALAPVGTTLYVYGGGWDYQNRGAGIQARSIGVSPDWRKFFQEQNKNYNYHDYDTTAEGINRYFCAGLDCSGFVGWAVYNVMNCESGRAGYVWRAEEFAENLAKCGFGVCERGVTYEEGTEPGDIISMKGHVWISLGTCNDGSTVIVHSTPSESKTGQPGGGVQVGAVGESKKCEAYRTAEYVMRKEHPLWYERYEVPLKEPEIYYGGERGVDRFRWKKYW